jgi:hypothetical protein
MVSPFLEDHHLDGTKHSEARGRPSTQLLGMQFLDALLDLSHSISAYRENFLDAGLGAETRCRG